MRVRVGFVVLLVAILAEIVAILFLNGGGPLTYTLDDAYIHLALAENIAQSGHYGFNAREYSSPASSVLWPFLLASFARLPFAVFVPLAINIAAAFGTVICYERVLRRVLPPQENNTAREKFATLLLVLLILATNVVGLIFTGMEHSLQLLLTAIIALGLIAETQDNTASWGCVAAIALAPTIRYENLSVSVAALLYLALRGHWEKVIVGTVLTGLPLSLFSYFLADKGLAIFPVSVMLKSSVVGESSKARAILGNLRDALDGRRGTLLSLFFVPLVGAFYFQKNDAVRKLAACATLAVALHLLFGRYGWYNRYEVYIWAFALLVVLFLLRDLIATTFERVAFVPAAAMATFATYLISLPYLVNLVTLPLAANNLYEQQYQMHRFAAQFYKQPVAVNDIGYVGYNNDAFVLDLWGQSSPDALVRRLSAQNPLWMGETCRSHNVRFVMIYDFPFGGIPDDWIKLGTLQLSRPKIAIAGDQVSFYALDKATAAETKPLLRAFVRTLPKESLFGFAE